MDENVGDWESEHKGLEKRFRSCIIIKPDATTKGKIGRIISRYEELGVEFKVIRTMYMTREVIEKQYIKYIHQPFFLNLVSHLITGPSILAIVEGHQIFYRIRKLHGYYNPDRGSPGEIRFDLGHGIHVGTLVHCSEDEGSYGRELQILFPDLIHGF